VPSLFHLFVMIPSDPQNQIKPHTDGHGVARR
jgi:hypothetical protein